MTAHSALSPPCLIKLPRLLVTLLVAVPAAVIHFALSKENEFATTRMVAEGIGEVPYQFRILGPKLSLALSGLFTPSLGADEALYLSNVLLNVFACTLIHHFAYQIASYFRISDKKSWWIGLTLVPVLLAVFLLPRLWGRDVLYYVSDFPSVAFFSGAISAILRRSWIVFTVLFLVGAVNRGTILLVIWPLLMLGIDRREAKQSVLFALGVAIAYGLIMSLIWWHYRDNPGRAVHLSIPLNIQKCFSLDVLITLSALTLSGLIPTFFLRNNLPSELRRALSCVLPYMALIVFSGAVTETRIFGELVPLGWVGWFVGSRWVSDGDTSRG